MKSRHLGLVMGFEKEHDVQALAALLEKHAAIDEILKLRAPACPAGEEKASAEKSVRIGIAQDEAFCFYYYENLRELETSRRRAGLLQPARGRSARCGRPVHRRRLSGATCRPAGERSRSKAD